MRSLTWTTLLLTRFTSNGFANVPLRIGRPAGPLVPTYMNALNTLPPTITCAFIGSPRAKNQADVLNIVWMIIDPIPPFGNACHSLIISQAYTPEPYLTSVDLTKVTSWQTSDIVLSSLWINT